MTIGEALSCCITQREWGNDFKLVLIRGISCGKRKDENLTSVFLILASLCEVCFGNTQNWVFVLIGRVVREVMC